MDRRTEWQSIVGTLVATATLWLGLACAQGAATAGRDDAGPTRLGIATGYSWGDLNGQDEYHLVPGIVRFSFDTAPLLRRYGARLPGELDFCLEPYFSQVLSPAHRQEFGCGLFLRWIHDLWGERLRGYLEIGAAPMYMTVETNEQSTHFNFLDQGGVGLLYGLSDDWSIEVGARIWHISNAGIKRPNHGINGSAVLVGFSRSL